MSRNGNCDAKRHGNASAGTMVRLQLVFHGQGKQKQSTKHTKKRPNKGWSRTRSERGPNEVPNEVKNYPGQTLTQILELEDFRLQLTVVVEYAHPKTKKTNTELSKERVEYAHPKTKKTNTEVTQMVIKWYHEIRRPLPSFGLGGAAPGITVGVQHGPVPALSFSMAPSRLQKLQKLLSGTFSATLPAAFDGLSLLCHGSSRGPTSCFCWASKLLSGTSEAPQAVSIGFRNCYLARFQHPLKASKPSKPSQQPSTAFRCFAMGPPEAPRAVSVGLRKCYLTLPRRHELFLLGFETAIWHVAAFDGHSLLCHGSSRGPTSCFCWASSYLIWHVFSTP